MWNDADRSRFLGVLFADGGRNATAVRPRKIIDIAAPRSAELSTMTARDFNTQTNTVLRRKAHTVVDTQ